MDGHSRLDRESMGPRVREDDGWGRGRRMGCHSRLDRESMGPRVRGDDGWWRGRLVGLQRLQGLHAQRA